MPVNTTRVVGEIRLPQDTVPENSVVHFKITGFDTDVVDNVVIAPRRPQTAQIQSDGTIDINLWPNDDGTRSTLYNVELEIYNGNSPYLVPLGQIEVPQTAGPHDLTDLLPVQPPADTPLEEYLAQLQAAISRTEAAADRAELAAGDVMPVEPPSGGGDAYASIQAALDAANTAGGGTVRLLSGVYEVSQQLRLYSNVTFEGVGETTILRRNFNTSPTGAGLIGVTGSGINIALRNMTVDVNGDTFTTGANGFGAVGIDGLVVEGVTFLDVPNFHAIDIANARNVLIENCRFMGFFLQDPSRTFSEAIQLDPDLANGGNDNSNIRVLNNYFGANPGTPTALAWPAACGNHAAASGNYSDHVWFEGNLCEGLTYAVMPMINFRRVNMSSNTLRNCARGVALEFHKVSDGNWQRCSDISVVGNVWQDGTGPFFFVFTPAFTTAAGNDTHDRITVTSNVINDTGSEAGFDVKWLRDFVFSGNTLSAVDGGFHLRFCTNGNISGNNVRNSSANGVWMYESGETDFVGDGLSNNITISSNHFENLDFRGVHVNCNAQRTAISGNTIVDANQASGGTRPAIQSDSGADNTSILGNTIQFSAAITSSYSIVITSGSGHVVKGNNAPVGATNAYRIAASGTLVDIEGNGSPNGVISAAIGSQYRRLDGGAGTAWNVKETGTGNTGWTAK